MYSVLFITTGLQYTAERAATQTHTKTSEFFFFFWTLSCSLFMVSEPATYRWCCETSWRPSPHDPIHTRCRTLSQAEQKPQTDLHWTHRTPLTQSGKGRFHKQQNLLEEKTVWQNLETKTWCHDITCRKKFRGGRDRVKPALMQLKSRGTRSWILRPWNSKGLAQ